MLGVPVLLVMVFSAFSGAAAVVNGILILFGTIKLETLNQGIFGALFTQGIVGTVVFLVLGAVTALTARENIWLILSAGLVVWLVRAPPAWLRRSGTAAEAGGALLLLKLLGFFAYAGSFVFGSGLAIVPFLHGGVVLERHWLTERQFLDAVAVALITPGPVVITTGFIGYLIAGFPGACVAAGATFLPCFLLTVIPAPYFHRYGTRPWLQATVKGITAAATGAIVGAVIVLARQSLSDGLTAGVAAMAFGLTLLRWKVPEPLIVGGAALVGLLARSWS
jgi:chromate transporter